MPRHRAVFAIARGTVQCEARAIAAPGRHHAGLIKNGSHGRHPCIHSTQSMHSISLRSTLSLSPSSCAMVHVPLSSPLAIFLATLPLCIFTFSVASSWNAYWALAPILKLDHFKATPYRKPSTDRFASLVGAAEALQPGELCPSVALAQAFEKTFPT